MDYLEEAVRNLPTPENYWRGISTKRPLHPENLVFFSRLETSEFTGDSPIIHYRYNIVFSLKGFLQIHLDNRTVNLEEGEFIVIFPYQSHYYISDRPREILYLFIGFDMDNQEDLEPLRYERIPISPFVEFCLRNILSVPPNLQTNLLSAILTAGLNYSHSGRCNYKKNSLEDNFPVISRTRDYVYSHMEEPLTASLIAGEIGVSESALYKVFHKTIGISPGRYIREIKINHACSLLESGNCSVTEVSRLCGYDSLFSFSRAFKNATGISPSRFGLKRFRN